MSLAPTLEQALTDAIRRHQSAPRPIRRRRVHPTRLGIALACLALGSASALAATHPWSERPANSAGPNTRLDLNAVTRGERPAAPNANLPVLGTHRTVSLSSYRGRVLVLTFWASWCGPCRDQAATLNAMSANLKADGNAAAVLVDHMDAAAAARQYLNSSQIRLPVLEDKNSHLARRYASQNPFPSTLVIDPYGRVASLIRGAVGPAVIDRAIQQARQPGGTSGR